MTETNITENPQAKPFRFSDLFIPHHRYVVTPLLVLINLGVFLSMGISSGNFLSFTPEILLDWGGNTQACFAAGQYARLITSCFVHTGLLHLVMNLPELIFIGYFLEKEIESRKFLFAYLLTGVVSSLFSLFFYENMVSCGASGAILGMFGLFLPLLVYRGLSHDNKRIGLLVTISVLAACDLLSSLQPNHPSLEFMQQFIGETDNAAHWDGFLSGLFIGSLYRLRLSHRPDLPAYRYLSWSAPVVLSLLLFFILFARIDYRKSSYTDLRMRERIMRIEVRANEEITFNENHSDEIVIQEIEERNKHLDSCIVLLDTYLKTPAADSVSHREFEVFLKYFRLRYSYNQALIRYISNGSNPDDEVCLLRIETALDSVTLQLNPDANLSQEEF